MVRAISDLDHVLGIGLPAKWTVPEIFVCAAAAAANDTTMNNPRVVLVRTGTSFVVK
jgi:hypothetical protein